MGRTGNRILEGYDFLYGSRRFQARSPARRPGSFRLDLERLRAACSPVWSRRLSDGNLAEAHLEHPEGERRSVLRVRETYPDGEPVFKTRTYLPERARDIKLIKRHTGGLEIYWKAEGGAVYETHSLFTGASSSKEISLAGDLFCHDKEARICSAGLNGDSLEVNAGSARPKIIEDIYHDSVLVQGPGGDRNLVMVQSLDGSFWVVDMTDGRHVASVPCLGGARKASFLRVDNEFFACYLDRQNELVLSTSERGELFRGARINSDIIFQGQLSPMSIDRDGKVCMAWANSGGEIFGMQVSPGDPGETGGRVGVHLGTCEPGVELESLAVVPGSGQVVWSQYSKEGKPAIGVSPISWIRRSASTVYLGDHEAGDRLWIDSVRGNSSFSGGEVLWRLAKGGARESKLLQDDV